MTLSRINSIVGSSNVITGCGSGLGKATLEWFLKKGSGPVLGIDRSIDADYVDKLDVSPEQKGKLLSLQACNTFDESKVEDCLREFVNNHGTIDNVINVAGVSLAFMMMSKTRQEVYNIRHAESLLEFNTVGNFNLIRLASRYMIDSNLKGAIKKPKCIINTSAISSQHPSIGQTSYAASTSAIDSMTLCIARELSPFNIRCNTINVGYFDTRLLSEDQRVKDYIASEVALCPERLGRPEEFAHFVQAMIENEMLNGCCVKIDAGAREAM